MGNNIRVRGKTISSILAPEATTPRNRAVDWKCLICKTCGTVLYNQRDPLLTIVALAMLQHGEAHKLGRRMVEYRYVNPVTNEIVKSQRPHHGFEAIVFSEVYKVTPTTQLPLPPMLPIQRGKTGRKRLVTAETMAETLP